MAPRKMAHESDMPAASANASGRSSGDWTPATGGVKSCYRVTNVLDFFREYPGPARGIDIAHAIRIPVSSTNELLKTLVDTGYINFEPATKRYSLSLRFLTLADSIAEHNPGLRGLLSAARVFHTETGDTVAILIRNGHRMQFLYKLTGTYAGPPYGSVPILGTAAGGAQLMTLRPNHLSRVVRPALRLYAPQRRGAEFERLMRKLEWFRTEGVAISDENIHPQGIRAVAIPVVVPGDQQPPLVFGVGGHKTSAEIARTGSFHGVARTLRSIVSEYVRTH